MGLLMNARKAWNNRIEDQFLHVGSRHMDNIYLFWIITGFAISFFFMNITIFMDDVFIYFRVAKHINEGLGPVFNPGDHHFAVTSPLWVFLLAFLSRIFSFMDLLLLAKMIFCLLLVLASLLAFLSIRKYVGAWGVLVSFPIIFNFITVTTVGGEIALVYAALFGIIWAYYIKRHMILTGLLVGVAYLARAELILIIPIIILHYVYSRKKEQMGWKSMMMDGAKFLAAFLLIAGIWHLYYAIHFHTFFPNTLHTKIVQGKSGRWALYYNMSRVFIYQTMVIKHGLIFFLLFGLIYFREISLTLLLFTMFHYYAYKFLTVPFYHWYYYDFFLLIPVFTLFGVIAFFLFLRNLAKVYGKRGKGDLKIPLMVDIATGLLVLIAAGNFVVMTTKINTLDGFKNDFRYKEYEKISGLLRPMVNKGDVFLTPEIGIFGYFMDQAVVRDLNGIASPDVTVKNINDWHYFIKSYTPKFIYIPDLVPKQDVIKYYKCNTFVRVYKRKYEGTDMGTNLKGTFYVYDKSEPAPGNVYYLEKIRNYPNCYSGYAELAKVKDDFVLAVQPPFYSRLKLKQDIGEFTVRFGFLGDFLNDRGLEKASFRVMGTKGDTKMILMSKILYRGDGVNMGVQQEKKILLGERKYDYLEFIIENLIIEKHKTPVNACAYWDLIF